MPRNPANNPTDRIHRLLDDLDHAEAYIDQLEELLEISHSIAALAAVRQSRPAFHNYKLEEQRQKLTLGRVVRNRAHMRRVRTASEELGNRAVSFKQVAEHMPRMSADRKAELDRLIEESKYLDPSYAIPSGTLVPPSDALPVGVEIEPDPEASGDDILQDIGRGKGLFGKG
jgi:hypothetical protein